MSSMRRVVKKLDRYVCAADVFGIYEDEIGIAFLDSSLVNNLGHYSIIGRCPYLRLVKNGNGCFLPTIITESSGSISCAK